MATNFQRKFIEMVESPQCKHYIKLISKKDQITYQSYFIKKISLSDQVLRDKFVSSGLVIKLLFSWIGNSKMCMNLTENPYLFLRHSINICMVDDDPQLLKIYSDIFNFYMLYSFTTCSHVSEADLMLSSTQRFHVCIMDLGLGELNNDEFYLLKKYSPYTSFIVLTGNDSVKKGFECGKYGSLYVFEKPIDFCKIDFINAINRAFIYSLVSSCSKYHKPVVEQIVNALFVNPADILHWALNANVTEQYLRRIWNTIYGYQPKYFLWFYKMMLSAFEICNLEFLMKTGSKSELSSFQSKRDEKENLSVERYFQSNRSIFNQILYHVQNIRNSTSNIQIDTFCTQP